ncbi:uncharacterized protein LOC121387123 [Gigantopelta aegis]|uniref:uncharacterized protein LOC121387123 n=1 Tax=Gigantopelta aegis TaxID=1735272 RepID=UPI001B88CAF9|nr:uncharacterized protein LOC121387123 [Gigantopelta aegis]
MKHDLELNLDPTGRQKLTVPYRLPRIPPRSISPVDAVVEENRPRRSETMWGRFGYEAAIRIPTLLPSVNKMMVNTPNPSTSLAVPRFQNAGIMPLKYRQRHRMEDDMIRSLLQKADKAHTARETTTCRGDPSPTPVYSRVSSPTKSARSIHWTLGDHVITNSPLFDRKGRSRAQGPFSREFTVTCFAPHNWLRLKLGRSRSMMH